MDEIFAAEDFLQKLCRAWRGKIDLAKTAKKPWTDIREQCLTFFAGTPEEFWQDSFQRKFFGTPIPAKFKIQINKAFEFIAIVGPVLYERNPVRDVYPNEPIDLEPGAFGDPNDPNVQAMFQQAMYQQQLEQARNNTRCSLVERYLNYTPNEQPFGGLQQHAHDAITDGMLGGLGLLWVQTYRMPGSSRTLTGAFYDSSENLFVDPDPRSMDFGKAKWVAREHVTPVWELEQRFRLEPGTLKRHAYLESATAQSERRAGDLGHIQKSRGTTHDLIRWWEIWSCGGVGTRMTGADPSLNSAFDRFVGDYAYLAIAAGDLPYPLNCPLGALRTGSIEDIQQRFRWPIPFWQDKRWPFSPLSFYRHPSRTWPIAPLAPGLGELAFLNFIISRCCNHVWQSSRQFIGVIESARKEVETMLKRADDLAILPVKDSVKSIKNMIDFLVYPNLIQDVWTLASWVMEMFDKRVGLTEIQYGIAHTQSRTATDTEARNERANIRGDFMAHCVEEWMTEVAVMEKLAAFWGTPDTGPVQARDVAPLLGTAGAMLWDQLFTNADPESIAREVYCRVAAGTARKRNRQSELGALREFYPPMSQTLGQYGSDTTDTQPLNVLHDKLFDAMNFDGSGLEMGPWAPPPPPDGADPEEAEEVAKEQEHEAELERDDESHDQEMRHREEQHDQELAIKEEVGDLEIRLKKSQAAAQTRVTRVKSQSTARK